MAGFPKKYVYTSGDPSKSATPPGVGVAIKIGGEDGATPEQIAAFKAAHPNNPIIIWQSEANQAGADAVKQYGAVAYIAQGESPYEMGKAAEIGSQIAVPKIIVTYNVGYAEGKWPPGYGVSFEYYPNSISSMNPVSLANALKEAQAMGATSVQVTIGSWGKETISMTDYQKALDYLKSQGLNADSVSAYIWDQMTAEQQAAFMEILGVTPPTTGSSATPTGSTPTATKPKPKPKLKPTGQKPEPPKPELGIQHEKPLSEVASHGYKGETDPKLTYSYTDKANKDNTLTFRPNGIVVQTKADGTSFVVWDPKNHDGQHWPGFQNQNIKDPYADATFNENANAKTPITAVTPSGEPRPAWHANPGWKGLDDATKEALKKINGIDSTQVLEEREGANSDIVIFRMADGTYKSYNMVTGEVSGAGTWDNKQWNSTGYGDQISGGGSSTTTSDTTANTAQKNTSGVINLGEFEKTSSNGQKLNANIELEADGRVKIKADNGAVLESFSNRQTAAKSLLSQAESGVSKNSRITIENGPSTSSIVIPADRSPMDVPSSVVDTFIGNPNAHGSCFPAGSLILTADGHKAIEEIKLGDKVKTWDFDSKRMNETDVTDVMAHYQRSTIIINTDRGSVVTTPEHPFWNGQKWLAAHELKAGHSKIYHQIGELCQVTSVEDGPRDNVYNFHVASPAHNYFVDGFLVHNMKMVN